MVFQLFKTPLYINRDWFALQNVILTSSVSRLVKTSLRLNYCILLHGITFQQELDSKYVICTRKFWIWFPSLKKIMNRRTKVRFFATFNSSCSSRNSRRKEPTTTLPGVRATGKSIITLATDECLRTSERKTCKKGLEFWVKKNLHFNSTVMSNTLRHLLVQKQSK